MYRSQNNITMWQLSHNTIAGDMGVTVLIQVSGSARPHQPLR